MNRDTNAEKPVRLHNGHRRALLRALNDSEGKVRASSRQLKTKPTITRRVLTTLEELGYVKIAWGQTIVVLQPRVGHVQMRTIRFATITREGRVAIAEMIKQEMNDIVREATEKNQDV